MILLKRDTLPVKLRILLEQISEAIDTCPVSDFSDYCKIKIKEADELVSKTESGRWFITEKGSDGLVVTIGAELEENG